MMEFIIGIIDEEQKQLRDIRRTVKINMPSDEQEPKFHEYELSGNADTLPLEVSQRVVADILKGSIDGLIIDYKIMIKTASVEGTDIYKIIHDHAPEFPIVILTDWPNECYKKDFIDADKVYEKCKFFKVDEDYSKSKVFNLFQNMKRYKNVRNGLELEHMTLQSRLEQEGSAADLIDELVKTETKLSDYKPLELTQFEKAYDPIKIKETIELLKEVDSLLEE